LLRRILVWPHDPDSAQGTVADSVAVTQRLGRQSEEVLIASKLAASQFGSRTNMAANQFESGVDFADRENRRIG
jgi:hypothetical protein